MSEQDKTNEGCGALLLLVAGIALIIYVLSVML